MTGWTPRKWRLFQLWRQNETAWGRETGRACNFRVVCETAEEEKSRIERALNPVDENHPRNDPWDPTFLSVAQIAELTKDAE